jgi:2-methylfumaryl-CoA hydratase
MIDPPIPIGGPWFEDLELGMSFDAPAITVTDGHAALHAALFGDRLRLALDHHASRSVTGKVAPLLHPLVAVNMAIGQSTWASQRVKGNLFYRGLVLRRPVFVGDTLHTTTRVVALRQNRAQAGRAATGIAALEMTTIDQHGDTVLRFWRCPMLPCRDPQAVTGHADGLDTVGADAALPTDGLPRGWSLAPTTRWQGLRAHDLRPGQAFSIEARDTITSAPELVRISLNMAMAHTDAKLSHLGERLVYGGHVIFMAFAQVTRALPNLLTLTAWESCDHLAPVVENDRLRSALVVTDIVPVGPAQGDGALLRIAVESFAARGDPEVETRVLDWKFWAWSV